MRPKADPDFACLEDCSVLLDCCYLIEKFCKLRVHFGFPTSLAFKIYKVTVEINFSIMLFSQIYPEYYGFSR